MALKTPHHWRTKPINIFLLGGGGNGSETIDCLAQFHCALLALNHPYGLNVTLFDAATVRSDHIVRQRFWPSDIGMNKAICLINRYNINCGTNWTAVPSHWDETQTNFSKPDLIITAVDRPSVRVRVAKNRFFDRSIWIDLGNHHRSGQAIVGVIQNTGNQDNPCPNVMDHYPDIVNMPDDESSSCSAAESISKQDVLTNRTVSAMGMELLWDLLRYGKTLKNGLIRDLKSGRQLPIPF